MLMPKGRIRPMVVLGARTPNTSVQSAEPPVQW
jgi:hypothetical protein